MPRLRTAILSCAVAIAAFALSIGYPPGAGAAPTSAELQRASGLFQQGKRAFDAGRFEAAAHAFDEAFRTVPHAGTAFNAAVAWEHAGDIGRAGDAYVLAIEAGGLDADRTKEATRSLRRIEATLPRVVVRTGAPARVTLAYRSGDAPLVVHPPSGTHEVVVEFAGGGRITREILVGKAPLEVRIEPPQQGATPETAALRAPPNPRAFDADTGVAPRVAGFISFGLAAAAGGAAIGLGVRALDARDEFDASGRTDAELREEAITLRTAANIAWGIAGAFAVTGVVLVTISYTESTMPAATAGLCVAPDRLSVCGRF